MRTAQAAPTPLAVVVGMPGLAAATGIGGTFMVLTVTGIQEAGRVAGSAAPRLMAAAFGVGQLLGPIVVGVLAICCAARR